jgi:hypothetical protein
MAHILCIDTDVATTTALSEDGHALTSQSLGYVDGRPNLKVPPHEVDLIVVDLKRPACFDESHLAHGAVGMFGPSDVLTAVSRAAVPLLIFLNPEWIRHVLHDSPDYCKLSWSFSRTSATKFSVAEELAQFLPDITALLDLPLTYKIASGPTTRGSRPAAEARLQAKPLLYNAVGDVFAQVVTMNMGTVWVLPRFQDNGLVAARFGMLLPRLRETQAALTGRGTVDAPARPRIGSTRVESGVGPPATVSRPAASRPASRDVFISHALEDKDDIARPLARKLMSQGMTVWFDEFELTLGDSIRGKIEEGLRTSRYGIVILSESFFARKWPRRELDALFHLEEREKRILPVWHELTADEVRSHSPLLADRVAVSTKAGLDKIVQEVLRALKSHP